jgi:hypothetical protein
MSKQQKKVKPEVAVTEEVENTNTLVTDEIIDVEWENVEGIFSFKQRLNNLENYFAQMCLQHEKTKSNLMSQIVYGQADLHAMAQKLQEDLNIDENLTYELKLPASDGEKGYFLRKDN